MSGWEEEGGGGGGVSLGERNTIFYTEKDSCVCVFPAWEEDWISSSMLKSIRYSVDYIGVLLKQTRYFNRRVSINIKSVVFCD